MGIKLVDMRELLDEGGGEGEEEATGGDCPEGIRDNYQNITWQNVMSTMPTSDDGISVIGTSITEHKISRHTRYFNVTDTCNNCNFLLELFLKGDARIVSLCEVSFVAIINVGYYWASCGYVRFPNTIPCR